MSQERFGGFKLRLLQSVDAWVGITNAFLPRARAAGIPEEKFHLIYGGVDVERYHPPTREQRLAARTRHGIPADARVVVSAGSVLRRKGMDRVLKAWATMRPREGRDLLLIVGPDSVAAGLPEAEVPHVTELRTFVETEKLGGTVRFVGFVEDLEQYLGMADLFLFLSRREGLGYVTVEAMACGLPCIVSELDGIGEELVDEDRTGHVVADADDAAGVAAKVSRILDDPNLRASMARQARESAVRRFSFETRAEALAALYRKLLEGSRPRR